MKRALAIFLLSVLVAACSRPSDDHVVTVEKDDPAMNAAFAKARSETDSFLSLMNSGTVSGCSVKVGISDGHQTEYFWLGDLTYADGVFSGTIDNDPELVKNVKLGQKYHVKKEEIYDWLYLQDGKMHGNYTARVLLPKMPKEEADKIRAMMAD